MSGPLTTSSLFFNTLPPYLKNYSLQRIELAIFRAFRAARFILESIPHLDQFVPVRMIESTQWGEIA